MKTSIESYSSVPLINSGSVSEFGKGGLHRFSESMVDIRKKACICFARANTPCLAKIGLIPKNWIQRN